MKRKTKLFIIIILTLIIVSQGTTYAETNFSLFGNDIKISESNDPQNYVSSIQLLVLFTILTLAPSILIMMTSFKLIN